MPQPNTFARRPELPSPLAQDICASFGLGEHVSNQLIGSGIMHASYYVDTAAGRYVAKALSYVNSDILANERHVQAQLHEYGVRAPRMLANEDGQFVYTGHGHSVTMSQRLAGTHPGRPASDEHCFSVGQALGTFHQAVSSTTHRSKHALLARSGVDYRIAMLEQRAASVAPVLARLVKTSSAVLFDKGLPEGVLHGDFHTENVLVEGNDVAVLDLETITTGPFIQDIGRSVADLCHRPGFTRMDDQKVARFVDGYSEVRPLTAREQEALPAATVFGCTALAAQLYTKRLDGLGDIFLQLGTSVDSGL